MQDGQWTEAELQGLLAQFRAQPGQAFLQRTARAHGNLVPRRGEDVPEELLEDIEEPGVLKIALNHKKTTINMRS